jgi:hypothetical protein
MIKKDIWFKVNWISVGRKGNKPKYPLAIESRLTDWISLPPLL